MLTTTDIERQLKGVRFFAGVFACDMIPSLNPPATLIVNTDPSHMEGEHWVALHLFKGGCDFFDPLGFPPFVSEIQAYMAGRGHLRYNMKPIQGATRTTCGDYCICFVKCVAAGVSMPEFIQRFTHQLLEGSENNEEELQCLRDVSC